MLQPTLPGLGDRLPHGFSYAARFVSPAEHDALLAKIRRLPFGEFRMRGVAAKRRVVHFGWDYDPDRRNLRPGDLGGAARIPSFLLPLRDRCAALAGEDAAGLEEGLATFYPPGATIGWHRDAAQFGTVIGVSFSSTCRLRYRREIAGRHEQVETLLDPASAYVLAGAARWSWQHHIPALKAPRWSITFRTVRPQPDRPQPAQPRPGRS
jgi:alkylated DNA repair dioxygenase AlkB